MSTETVSGLSAGTMPVNEYLSGLTDKTILVTGASGYVGSALLSSLYQIRCRIVALLHQRDCPPVPSESDASLIPCRVDLAKSSVWLDVLRDSQPDVIINLAAYEHRRNSQHSPALDQVLNMATVLELLETCRELEFKPRIVLASSANIVGCPGSMPVNEATPDCPLTLYAINKLAAEQYLRYYAGAFNLPAVSLRFANVYGPLQMSDPQIESRVVLNNIMSRALAGGPLYLYRNQNCLRDFVYVDDVVRAICASATRKITPGRKYIVGSGEGRTLKEIVNEIASQVQNLRGERVAVHLDEDAALEPIEWREFIADYSLLQSATGWEPRTKLREGIEATLRAFIGGQSQ